jgi:CBS domain-containing protein
MNEESINEELRIAAERASPSPRILDKLIIQEPIRRLDPRMPAICIETGAMAADVIDLMHEHKIGAVLITERGVLTGIVTERDILYKVTANKENPEQVPVQQIMTPAPETLSLDVPIVYALNKMGVGGFRHIPLVDAANRPVGVISVRNILRYVVDFFAREVTTLPPEPGSDMARKREGA